MEAKGSDEERRSSRNITSAELYRCTGARRQKTFSQASHLRSVLCAGVWNDDEALLELIMFIVSFDVINCEKCNFHISLRSLSLCLRVGCETHLNMIPSPSPLVLLIPADSPLRLSDGEGERRTTGGIIIEIEISHGTHVIG
jgi:hypothetical protein